MQRAQHERGVADPRVAVVPVAFAAGRLGQRGRRRGHDRPGRRVAQGLERERAALDVGTPGMVGDGRQREPVPPVLLGRRELCHRVVFGERAVAFPREREPGGLPLLERGASVGAGPEDAEPDAPGEVEGEIAGTDGDALVAPVVVAPLAAGGAVVELRDDVGLDFDPAAAARGDAQQRALRHRVAGHAAVAVTAFVGGRRPDDEQVPDDQPPGGRVPRRLEDVGAGDVPALVGDVDAGGPEAEEPGRSVEERTEHTGRIGAGQAEPFHRTVGGHQRADFTVRQERVVGDVRELTHGKESDTLIPGPSPRVGGNVGHP